MSVDSLTGRPALEVTADRLFAAVRAVLSSPTADTADASGDNAADAGALAPHLREAARTVFSVAPIRTPWVPPDPVRPDWLILELARRHPGLLELLGGGPLGPVSINPQPLPPRTRFAQALAQSIIDRATLVSEVAGTIANESEKRGIIIIGGYVARMTEELCPPFRHKWPLPPPPPPWYSELRSPGDLITIASEFDRAASEAVQPELQSAFRAASLRLAQAALGRQ